MEAPRRQRDRREKSEAPRQGRDEPEAYPPDSGSDAAQMSISPAPPALNESASSRTTPNLITLTASCLLEEDPAGGSTSSAPGLGTGCEG
eukprot:13624154-Heterocapsa_arctica.AAC.1